MWLLLALGCAPKPAWSSDGDVRLSALRDAGVAVMGTVLVRDLAAPPVPPPAAPGVVEQELAQDRFGEATVLDPVRDAAFLRNDYVGNVKFGGGLIRTGDVALEVRARLMEFNDQDRLAQQGRAWLDGAVGEALAGRGVAARPVAPVADLVVERVPFRGLHPDDGRDNLNVPRVDIRPGPLSEAARAAAGDDPYLLVPLLRQYYTHNGGWFIGQEWGTTAGARVEATLVLYDVRRGAPVWWSTATGRHIEPRVGQASRAELDQYLLWSEEQVAETVGRRLFR